jgi:putative two-component system response regulator
MQLDPITHVARDARILIVDDREDNTSALSSILRRAGYAICISMTDPREALRKFPDLNPDLVLLDWHMEPVSGLEFIEALKAAIPPQELPPVLIFSADASPETRREALAVGASDFLAKPLDASEVLLRIRNLLYMRLLHTRIQESHRELEDQFRERTGELQEALAQLRIAQHKDMQQERLRAFASIAASAPVF